MWETMTAEIEGSSWDRILGKANRTDALAGIELMVRAWDMMKSLQA